MSLKQIWLLSSFAKLHAEDQSIQYASLNGWLLNLNLHVYTAEHHGRKLALLELPVQQGEMVAM